MYVLMIVMTLATGERSITTQDFDSYESCEAAKTEIQWQETKDRIRARAQNRGPDYTYKLTCMPK